MKYLQNLIFRGGKSIGLLLLLFLMLGNGGVWAQEEFKVSMSSFTSVSGSLDDNISYTTAKGGAATAPGVYSNIIRLYQKSGSSAYGGTITIKAAEGYSLKKVVIGSGMATSVSYTKDDETSLSTSESISKDGKYTVENVDAQSITFYCMGSGSSARLYVNYLEATYVTNTISNDPSITAVSDVEYSADITSGEISYTINNPVEGQSLTASTVEDVDWIHNVAVDVTNNKVTFDMDENTTVTTRTAQIKLEYEGAEPQIVTVTQRGVVAKYNVTWSVNGVETTESVEEGQAVTFGTPTENIPKGYVFKGWYGNTLEPQDNAPEYVTSATVTADVTYYAVFAKSNGGGTETATLTASHNQASSGYNDETYTDDKNNLWVGNTSEQITNKIARIQLKSTAGSYLESPVFPGNITKIVLDAYNSGSSSRTYYIDSKKDNKSGDLGKAIVDASDKHGKEYSVVLGNQPFNKFFINVSGALGFSYIKVTYSSEVFTDFRTSVTDVPTATILILEDCRDNKGMYYGTYSNSKAFKVSEGLNVAKVSIDENNKLIVTTYGTGTIVPANTGVMVSAEKPDNYSVELLDEDGNPDLKTGNMLRPTGDNGIAAADMAANDANCKYYRLTMHNKETIGFFWGAAEGAAFNLAANKAYLAVPVEQAAKIAGFNIGGGSTTSIAGITAGAGADGERKVYNLQGQRVSGALAKGLYIIDGKKVIIK